MNHTDLIFDLYGTLVDIHTEENDLVWEKTALYFGYYGAHYTGEELRTAFQSAMAEKKGSITSRMQMTRKGLRPDSSVWASTENSPHSCTPATTAIRQKSRPRTFQSMYSR